jgi:hypothetical protein
VAAGEQPAMIEEDVDELPQDVVGGLDELLGDERIRRRGHQRHLGTERGEGDGERPGAARVGDRGCELGFPGAVAERHHDVVGADCERELHRQGRAVAGEAERG